MRQDNGCVKTTVDKQCAYGGANSTVSKRQWTVATTGTAVDSSEFPAFASQGRGAERPAPAV